MAARKTDHDDDHPLLEKRDVANLAESIRALNITCTAWKTETGRAHRDLLGAIQTLADNNKALVDVTKLHAAAVDRLAEKLDGLPLLADTLEKVVQAMSLFDAKLEALRRSSNGTTDHDLAEKETR